VAKDKLKQAEADRVKAAKAMQRRYSNTFTGAAEGRAVFRDILMKLGYFNTMVETGNPDSRPLQEQVIRRNFAVELIAEVTGKKPELPDAIINGIFNLAEQDK
jgi:hypothetical protein